MMAIALKVEPLSGTVDEAKTKVDALARLEVDNYRQVAPKKRELFEAQQAKDFKKAAVLREEVEYLEDTRTGRDNRRAAILNLHVLQAQAMEAKAATIRAEVEVRQAKANTLLAQLKDLENTEMRTRYLSDRTTTQQLEAQVMNLDVTARLLRRPEVADYGMVTGHTAEELIEALMRTPEVLGPSIASIYEKVYSRRGAVGNGQYMKMTWIRSHIDELEWDGIILNERPKR